MCGRFTIAVDKQEMKEILDKEYGIQQELPLEFILPRFNVAPGQNVLAIINDGKNYRVGPLKWGFVPFWAKDEKIGFNMINAQSETLSKKPAFKSSFQSKRCLILADSFYEWKKVDKTKIPMRIQLTDRKIFSFAGLWSTYKREDGTALYTCTIITTEPNEVITPIHNRMPVILTKENEQEWLNPSLKDVDLLTNLLKPYEGTNMRATPVSSLVNNPRNETMDCIAPL